MNDLKLLHRKMIDEQIIARGVASPQVISAMYAVERHRFIPPAELERAYADQPVPIGHGQTISQPYMVALMTEKLHLAGQEKVLEIGTGSGYQTAILARLAQQVCTIERFLELSRDAASRLGDLGYTNVKFSTGDGSLGWKAEAPFDRILITAACPRIPFPLQEQLSEGGIIVLPAGENRSQQELLVGVKKDGLIRLERVCECVFVPLIGEFGMDQN